MNDVTQLIERAETGDRRTVDELLPFVYDQLRRCAHQQLVREATEQSLQTADLVHETYLRLVGSDQSWHGRGHVLAAAAEAMRRILVERARKKQRIKHGGLHTRVALADTLARREPSPEEVIMVSELLESLAGRHPAEAEVVKLHYFGGLNISEAGRVLGISSSTAHRHWMYARAWLHEAIHGGEAESGDG